MDTEKKQLDFVAIGDITTDAFIQLDSGARVTKLPNGSESLCLNFGDKIEYEDVTVVKAVGNSPNAATAAKRLGLNTGLVTHIGDDDNGSDCLSQLKLEGISTEYVITQAGQKTNYHYVLRHGAERTILIKHYKYDYTLPIFTTPPRWLYFSSVGEDSMEYHHSIAQYVKQNPQTKLAFQPGTFQIKLGYETLKDLYETTEVFFCNKQEAQRILQTDESNMLTLLTEFRKLGPSIAIITDGPNGAYAQSDEGSWSMPMYPDPAPPVDRTGAGDSFSSTVIAMLAMGKSLPEALMCGPINSMSVVQHIGAQAGLLSKEQLEQYLADAPADYTITEL
jgi:sugar/nucleoside kinase (ribokinase family)